MNFRGGRLLATLLAVFGFAAAFVSPATADVGPVIAAAPTSSISSSRTAAYAAYHNSYLPAVATKAASSADAGRCVAGTPTSATQSSTLAAVNYFRTMVGLRGVTLDAGLTAKAQQAALMMSANNALSHGPPTTWKCYSQTGADAAGHSNLALGAGGAQSIPLYMDDNGTDSLGHRRWLLHAPLTGIGSGSTSNSNALYVITPQVWDAPPAGTPAYAPWPASGWVPVQVAPTDLWSVSATNDADFSAAKVAVKRNGVSVSTTTTHPGNGYGPNTVAFRFARGYSGGAGNVTYAVTITGIRSSSGAALPAYSYTTTLFDGDVAGTPQPQTITFTTPAITLGSTATLAGTATSGLPVSYASQTPSVCGVSGATVTALAVGTCTVTANQPGNASWSAARPVTSSVNVGIGGLTAIMPRRLVDTRYGTGVPKAQVPARGTVTFTAAASGTGAVVLNVTSTSVTSTGYLTVYPAGAARPTASTLNLQPGISVANVTVVKPGTGGRVTIYNGGTKPLDVVVDLQGYVTGNSTRIAGDLVPVVGNRLLDTRVSGGAFASKSTRALQVAGIAGVPRNAASVLLNLTAVTPSARGYVQAYPTGGSRPITSSVNFVAGVTRANLISVPVGADGTMTLFNDVGKVDLIADLVGYTVGETPTVTGRIGVVPPFRALDTRQTAVVPAYGSITVSIGAVGSVPADATAAIVNLTAVAPGAAGYLSLHPSDTVFTATSNVNFARGVNTAGFAIARLGPDGAVTIVNGSTMPVNILLDVTGYVTG